MWRFDASRSAISPHELPPQLHPQWVREYHPELPAWPDQEKMPFDLCYEPIVVGQTVYLNSARHDCVRAVDVVTGERKWIFFADGPVRFAPLHYKGNIYFTSDDGNLYCVSADAGQLVWKVRGGPSDRRILGNERLISTWPGRGAPVVADDTLYFAASIWPFMGVFIHAVDPATGRIIWTNDGDGSTYMKQPHATDAFASIAPQGPLGVERDFLVIPGGRSIPAIVDRKTGKLLRLPLADNGKTGGGSEVVTFGNVFFNGGAAFDLATSKYQGTFGKIILVGKDAFFTYENGHLKAFDPSTNELTLIKPVMAIEPPKIEAPKIDPPKLIAPKDISSEKKDATVDVQAGEPGKGVDPKPAVVKLPTPKITSWKAEQLDSIAVPPIETMIMAGKRIYGGGNGFIVAVDYDFKSQKFELAWKLPVEGKVCRLVAGADRLIAATRDGNLHCFGPKPTTPSHHPLRVAAPQPEVPAVAKRAQELLEAGAARNGYAVVLGFGDGELVGELLRHSNLRIVALEADAEKTLAGRRQHTVTDLYGSRLAILQTEPRLAHLPPYFCSAIFAPDWKAVGGALDELFLRQMYASLRPFGGRLVLSSLDAANIKTVEAFAVKTPQAKVHRLGDTLVVSREGPLPGSANWTHEHADASNTRVGKDTLVKAPMGILWFGGPSHEGVLPRHGHGPQPQVIDGRILIEGVNMIRALDIYTGRMLWETSLPGVGAFFNNLAHQAGANASGSNMVSTSDAIYVALRDSCVALDPDTGKIKQTFRLPSRPNSKDVPLWGYINVEGDYLIGGADPIFDPKSMPPASPPPGAGDDDPAPTTSKSLTKVMNALKAFSDNMSASRRLVVMNRHTGKVLWETSADFTYRHNGTVVGGGRLFTIDRMGIDEATRIKGPVETPYSVVAFDLATGKKQWEVEDHVFGTWLSYSAKYDILVEAGRLASDTLRDEPRGVCALDARTGKQLWYEKTYGGPAMIHGDEILLDSGACDLRTGALKMRKDPITGEDSPWKWIRTYGCNTPAASENLLTFRSGAAGYFDLCNDGGTGNFGGFRSSCTNNLVVAGGILTVPEYTRTCTCNYQNQTSVAIVHMPDAEMWTYFGTKEVKGAVKRLGINLGAAGDRRAESGTLWLEFPSTGGVSPSVNVGFNPKIPVTYRRFSGLFTGPYNWVGSSGIKGAQEITVPLGRGGPEKSRLFTVRLIFAEPELIEAGKRLANVDIQGERKLSKFDIVAAAGGARETVIREFRGIPVFDVLTLRLGAVADSLPPVLSGIEIVEEDGR